MNRFARFAAPIGLIGLTSQVHAAVPAEVSTALDGMAADGVEMATLVLVAVIAVAAVLFLKKALGR